TYNMGYLPMDIFLRGQATNSFLDGTVPNPFYGILPVNSTFGASPIIAARELYRFLPLFNGVTNNTNPWAHYRYDALQLSAQKRFSGNRSAGGALTMVFAYTFSKNMQSANILNNWDLAEGPVHELVSYDKPHSLSYPGVGTLPFGKGRHFLTATNRYLDKVIGGWNMNWIYRYSSGIPVAGIDVVNYCADSFLVADQTHDHWFNNSANCYRA